MVLGTLYGVEEEDHGPSWSWKPLTSARDAQPRHSNPIPPSAFHRPPATGLEQFVGMHEGRNRGLTCENEGS